MTINGVLFQFFSWFLPRDAEIQNNKSLWKFLESEAEHLGKIGINAVWIPPVYKGLGGKETVGYDVYDHFDLGEFSNSSDTFSPGEIRTKYGDKNQLIQALQALKSNSIQVYADIVINHKFGGAEEDYFWEAIRVEQENRNYERRGDCFECGEIFVKGYTKFNFPARKDKYSSFKWNVRHFDALDTVITIRQGSNEWEGEGEANKYIYRLLYNELGYQPPVKSFDSFVSLEKGNYDYLTGNDIDYDRYDVREEIKYWGEWLVNELDLDGFRIDAVKHISADYIREWIGHIRAKAGKSLFTVCEYIAGDTSSLHDYITRVTATGEYPQTVSLLDFPLRFKFKDASYQNESYSLLNLSRGTLMAEQPSLAVTFVENHDYEFGRGLDSHVKEWFKPLAYTYILLRDKGYPCIFFADYYGSDKNAEYRNQKPGKEYIELLLKLRKQFALGEERYYEQNNVVGWVRMGGVPGAKGAMAALISNAPGGTVESIALDTGRINRKFYHLATLKFYDDKFVVVRGPYDLFGSKRGELYTNFRGIGDFVVEGRTASIWLEEGTSLS